MHARHNRASQRREKAKENKREKKRRREHTKAECTQAEDEEHRRRRKRARASARRKRKRTQRFTVKILWNPLMDVHDASRMAILLSVCWGRGGEGDSLQVSPFLLFLLSPYLPGSSFLFFFFRVRHFAKMWKKKKKKFCHNFLIFCWKKIVNFGEKKRLTKKFNTFGFGFGFYFWRFTFLKLVFKNYLDRF